MPDCVRPDQFLVSASVFNSFLFAYLYFALFVFSILPLPPRLSLLLFDYVRPDRNHDMLLLGLKIKKQESVESLSA